MIIVGLGLSPDGIMALIRDGILEFSVDIRGAAGSRGAVDLAAVPRVLAEHRYRVEDVDEWVVDGTADGVVRTCDGGAPAYLRVGRYAESTDAVDPAVPAHFGKMSLAGRKVAYTSYPRAVGQVAGAYCTSPFARRGEPAAVLLWSTSTLPRLYHVDAGGRIRRLGFAFPPARRVLALARERLGSGPADGGRTALAADLVHAHFDGDHTLEATASSLDGLAELAGTARDGVAGSVRAVLLDLLTERLAERLPDSPGGDDLNLCCTGDLAHNPAWLSALRGHPDIRELWAPPFGDDSGNAIGAAALHAGRHHGLRPLRWDLRRGNAHTRSFHHPAGWSVAPCRPEELARLLHVSGAPVAVLSERAALGRRALGGHSLLASAADVGARRFAERVHRGDPRRPVAALCLAERAAEVFEPGIADPYMLFEHRVRAGWSGRVPALAGPDGLARVQTVGPDDDPVLRILLREYHRWSGTPVLCMADLDPHENDTTPDVVSTMESAGVRRVWKDGVLFSAQSTD